MNGRNSISGYSKAKRQLDAVVANLNGGTPIAPWRMHDCRRTFATGLARLGVQLPVVERLLNHTSGSFAASPACINASTSLPRSARRWRSGVVMLALTRPPERFETRA
jgi:hypothetical protein